MGLLMTIVAPITLLLFDQDSGDLAFWVVIGVVAWVGLWLYQSVDAYWAAGGE